MTAYLRRSDLRPGELHRGERKHRPVADAYGRPPVVLAMPEPARFAAHLAALDQEQAAAGVYAVSISKLERRCGTGPRLGL
jgi:hypothetical protein